MDRFSARAYVNAGCFFPQQSLPNMNMMTICKSIGDILYEKGVIGHVTVDLVSFPDPTSPSAHPLFWAVDLNCNLTDYVASCLFFDFLMVSYSHLLILSKSNSKFNNSLSLLYRKANWTNSRASIPLIIPIEACLEERAPTMPAPAAASGKLKTRITSACPKEVTAGHIYPLERGRQQKHPRALTTTLR